jgi:FSR family fosmidomycin resistance protein-like MFS transporter
MAALSAGHFATDFANGALPALLPFFVDRFGLSYTLAAAVMLASTAASSLVQPLFGAWSDRRGAIWLLPAGVALAGIGIGLAAAAPAYWLVLCSSSSRAWASPRSTPRGRSSPPTRVGASARAG